MTKKIAVPATAPELDAQMESKFGRAPILLLVDADSMETEAVDNPARYAQSGAAVETAQLLSKHRVDAVIAERYGPKAIQALAAAGISRFFCPADGSVREAVSRYSRGELVEEDGAPATPTGAPGGRTGGGGGIGLGRGGGGGRGRGRGRGGGGGRR